MEYLESVEEAKYFVDELHKNQIDAVGDEYDAYTVKKNLAEVEELPDLLKNQARLIWKLVQFRVGGMHSRYIWKKQPFSAYIRKNFWIEKYVNPW